jgi:hypothetical protein
VLESPQQEKKGPGGAINTPGRGTRKDYTSVQADDSISPRIASKQFDPSRHLVKIKFRGGPPRDQVAAVDSGRAFGPRLTQEQVARFMVAATAGGVYDQNKVRHAIHAITGRPVGELTAPEAKRLLPDFQTGLVLQGADGRWFIDVPARTEGGT